MVSATSPNGAVAPARQGGPTDTSPVKGLAPQSGGAAVRAVAVAFGPALLLDALVLAAGVTTLATARGRSTRLATPLVCTAQLATLAAGAYLLGLRRRQLHWGATAEEARAAMPGDELIPRPAWASTRAITIAAPAVAVWPWLVQMGQNRGGLYSFDRLENLAGLDFHSADRIVPEWQQVKVGDPVRFSPDQDTMVIARLEPNRALVLRSLNPTTGQPVAGGDKDARFWAAFTWAFVLEPVDQHTTRLIVRSRLDGRPRRLLALGYALGVELPHCVMEWQMLRGIKQRAEWNWSGHGRAPKPSGRTAP